MYIDYPQNKIYLTGSAEAKWRWPILRLAFAALGDVPQHAGGIGDIDETQAPRHRFRRLGRWHAVYAVV